MNEGIMNIGINFINETDTTKVKLDDVYKYLINKGYINTIKFPSKNCNYDSLEYFLNFANSTGVKIDIHGLPGMVPAIHSENFSKNIEWERIKSKLNTCHKITTHMGLESKKVMGDYVEGTFENNLHELKEKLNCEVGLENIPGGFEFPKETLTPEFISKAWMNADFGVFDICHAKLAAKELGMSYQEYLERITNKEKVKVLHISGNITELGSRKNQKDKHVLINSQEIEDIIQLFNNFKNVNLIISEYAYNTKYSYSKEIIIEAVLLNVMFKTTNVEYSKYILKYLEKELKNDISNVDEILENVL